MRVLKALFIGAAVAVSATVAFAQPTTYGKSEIPINAGVLLFNRTMPSGAYANLAPHVFFYLDRRTDLKPAGWTFVNPQSSTSYTSTQASRWNLVTGGTGFTPGMRLGKNHAAYWEVDLDRTSSDILSSYDILYVNDLGSQITAEQREKLRRFVDGGGILWVDRGTGGVLQGINGYPVPFASTNNGNNPQVNAPLHPLMRFPYELYSQAAATMGTTQGNGAIIAQTLGPVGLGTLSSLFQSIEPGFASLNGIVINSAGVVVGAADIGAGKLVVTSGNVGGRLNAAGGGTDVGLGPNTGAAAGENLLALPDTELKFSYNLSSLGSSFGSLAGASRRLNSGRVSLGAPLLQSWSHPTLDMDGEHDDFFPPAVYKGLVFVTSGNTLYAFKADVSKDLDGDGWLDDGFQDASGGVGHDLVWRSTALNGPLSSPTAGEARAVGSAPRHQVYLVDGQGNLLIFNALPTQNGRLLGPNPIAPAAVVPPPSTPSNNFGQPMRGPYNPTAYDGAVYVFDTVRNNVGQVVGRVWAASQTTGQAITSGGTRWSASGQGAPTVPEPGGSPTIGTIPIGDGSGGLDSVMYVPNRSVAGGAAAGVTSIWIGAKGEAPNVNRTPNSIQVVTRAASKGLRLSTENNGFGIRISLVDEANGRALTAAEMAGYLNGTVNQFAPGQLNIGTNGSLPAGIGVRIDYHIDWGTGAPNLMAQVIRGQIFFPDDVNRTRYVVKSMALAPNGNLFVTTSNELTNGSLFVLNEFARGQFKLKYRWDLYEEINIQIGGANTQRWGPALMDMDYLSTTLVPFLNAPMRRLHFHGSPTIVGDVCYVTVGAEKRAFGAPRVTAIVALDADPDRIDIKLGAPITGGVSIRQPDIAASTNRTTPENYITMQGSQVDIDEAAGVIRFDNMMSNTNGQMRNALSTSLPVVVSSRTGGSQLIDPDATGSNWSPVLWYFVLNGFVNESPVFVTGNTIYMAGGNILPDMLAGQGFQPRPAMFAMEANIPPNDPSIITIPGRPGLKQSRWLYPDNSSLGFTGNPHVRWPSGEGIQSLNDFVIRLNQTLLDGSLDNMARGVIGGDGAVVAWADRGIHGFKKGITVVADEGRIIETDAAGFTQWTSDTTYQAVRNQTSSILKINKLVRPTKAYVSGENEYLIVDTGGDRILRLDKSAGEVRSIENFMLDATYRPDGYHAGDETRLRQPRDVSAWVDYVPLANNRLANPQPMEYWVHYLIADTGNRRMIELVDRYVADPNTYDVGGPVVDTQGVQQIGVLYWNTPENLSGKDYQYTSIKRFQIGIDNTGTAQFVYIAAVGHLMPTAVNIGVTPPTGGDPRTEGGHGGLVVFDSVTPAGNFAINEIDINGTPRRLTGINSISVRPFAINNGVIDYAIMITDATGVYEVARNGNAWSVVWMMPNNVYRTVRGVQLRASGAKRLSNGHVLITNSFVGKTDPGPGGDRDFYGEVTQWLGDTYDPMQPNLGFAANQVRLELPPIVGSRGLRNPQFADRH